MRFNKANCRIDFSTFFLFLTSRFLFKMNRGIILETIITYAAIRKINLLRKIARHMYTHMHRWIEPENNFLSNVFSSRVGKNPWRRARNLCFRWSDSVIQEKQINSNCFLHNFCTIRSSLLITLELLSGSKWWVSDFFILIYRFIYEKIKYISEKRRTHEVSEIKYWLFWI